MATWQFDLEVVPARKASAQSRTTEGYVSPDALNDMDWWEGHALSPDCVRRLEAILPWSIPWAEGWKVFGEEDGNRIDVIEDNDRVGEVRVRIDARSMNLAFLDTLIKFVDDCDCVFLTAEGRMVEPNLDALWVELQLSPASSFVQDPEWFLERLQQRRRKLS